MEFQLVVTARNLGAHNGGKLAAALNNVNAV